MTDRTLGLVCMVSDLGQRVRIRPDGREGVAVEFDLEGGGIHVAFDAGGSQWFNCGDVQLRVKRTSDGREGIAEDGDATGGRTFVTFDAGDSSWIESADVEPLAV